MSVVGQATAASDYKVIHEHRIALGDRVDHHSWRLIRFYLPTDVDRNYRSVLQMNINSTNKSQYNAIYLNPEFVPGESEVCDPISSDRNKPSRVDLLPYAEYNYWSVYHKVISGAYLQPRDNYLLICSRNERGEGSDDLDNFYLKDIVLHYRKEKPPPQNCSNVFEPVCGIDGQTYSNACEADRAGVEILYGEACLNP